MLGIGHITARISLVLSVAADIRISLVPKTGAVESVVKKATRRLNAKRNYFLPRARSYATSATRKNIWRPVVTSYGEALNHSQKT
jgi:hypothetical protein